MKMSNLTSGFFSSNLTLFLFSLNYIINCGLTLGDVHLTNSFGGGAVWNSGHRTDSSDTVS